MAKSVIAVDPFFVAAGKHFDGLFETVPHSRIAHHGGLVPSGVNLEE